MNSTCGGSGSGVVWIYCKQRVQIPGSVPGPVPTRIRTVATGFHTKPAPQKSTFLAPIKYLRSDRITT